MNVINYKIVGERTGVPRSTIYSAKDVHQFCIEHLYDGDILVSESSFILLLNRANAVVGTAKISQGGITSCEIDAKIVCKYVVENIASGVIVVHNHPSGRLQASYQDDSCCKKLQAAIDFFNAKLLDFVIVTDEGYLSYADEGKL